ncbi:MAG TPA: hypothetical protein VFS47_01080 [Steroidobacteraceae bacterium]|nr:hypothetical protein [Steroidobacteraceae bacterium]
MRNRANSAVPVICAVAALAGTNAVEAANWEFAPAVLGGYRYDDNYRLSQPGDEIEVSGAEVDATMLFRTIDPRTKVEIAPRVRATYFPNEGDEDSTDYFLRGSVEDRTPRRAMGVDASFAHEDVVRTEFSTEPQGSLGNPDVATSTTFLRNQRDLYQVTPSFSYDLSQRQRIGVDGQYTHASFDNNYAGAQVDFTQANLGVGWTFIASQRNSFTLRGIAAHYDTVDTAEAYGAQAEWGTQLSPTSRMYVRIGAQNTKPENRDSSTNMLAGLGGDWMGERNHLFLDLTRTVNAVAAGSVVERTELRFRLNHDISERITMLLGARGIRDEGIHSTAYPKRNYVTGQAGLEWRAQRSIAFTATYTYRWQDDERFPTDVSANGFLIGVLYQPKRDY